MNGCARSVPLRVRWFFCINGEEIAGYFAAKLKFRPPRFSSSLGSASKVGIRVRTVGARVLYLSRRSRWAVRMLTFEAKDRVRKPFTPTAA